MKLLTSEQMRDVDRYTIEKLGIPGIVLMEQAGKGVYKAVLEKFPLISNKRVLLLCGRGNNGGDGFVTARYLLNKGYDTKVWLTGKKKDVKGDALVNLKLFEKIGGSVEEKPEPSENELKNALAHSSLIIDALFGTGLSKVLKEPYLSIIRSINASGKPVVSVDIPSGVDASTGEIYGDAVKSSLTVTFAYPKTGHYLFPGASCRGELIVEDIGIPEIALKGGKETAGLICLETARKIYKPRRIDSHKGDNGHLLIIAGSVGKSGAAYLTSCGALRSGAGLITVAVPESLNPVMEAKTTEVMTAPLPEQKDGTVSLKAYDTIRKLLEEKDALVIGPGISVNRELESLIFKLLPVIKISVILDADLLNILSKKPDVLKSIKADVIITPHPGEMARLTGCSIPEIQKSRVKTAAGFSKQYGVVTVLKGAGTVISEKNGKVYINSTGNSGMAAGGMGDVLTGIIGGLAVQGYQAAEAAILGVFIHGASADKEASGYSPVGYSAMDVCSRIPSVLKELLC